MAKVSVEEKKIYTAGRPFYNKLDSLTFDLKYKKLAQDVHHISTFTTKQSCWSC